MLAIRLFRTGKKNQPFFKIVVTDKKNAPHGGRFLESLGYLNPLTKEHSLNGDRAKYWISVGAKPSDTVYNLLIKKKVIEGKKIPLHQVKPIKEEEKKEEIKKEEVVKTEEIKAEETKEVKEELKSEQEEIKVEEKIEEKPEEKEKEKVEEIAEESKEEDTVK